jgi:hypothetical protein
MNTTVKTLRGTVYPVSGLKREETGRIVLVGRQASGKARYLTKSEVGSARWYAALAHLTRGGAR